MPTPGFPNWACVGAIIRSMHDEHPGLWVIVRIEFQPVGVRGSVQPGYAFELHPVDEHGDRPASRRPWHPELPLTLNLPALDDFQWTGQYLDEQERVVSTGTTMPVTMYAQGLAPGDEVVISGSANHDGVFRVGYAQHQHIMLNRDHEPVGPDPNDDDDFSQLADPLGRPGLPTGAVLPDVETAMIHARSRMLRTNFMGTLPAREAHLDVGGWESVPASANIHDPPFGPGPLPDYNLVASTPLDDQAPDYNPHPHLDSASTPLVEPGQVWMLPGPNAGLWRVAAFDGLTTHLEHARERDRVMTCTRPWLIANGVRHEPADPRQYDIGTIALGQVWEIDPSHTRYSNITNRRWRVHRILDNQQQIYLLAEDGSGKRLYWAPSRLLTHGTFAGDGIPRRTSFEHVLADALDDDT